MMMMMMMMTLIILEPGRARCQFLLVIAGRCSARGRRIPVIFADIFLSRVRRNVGFCAASVVDLVASLCFRRRPFKHRCRRASCCVVHPLICMLNVVLCLPMSKHLQLQLTCVIADVAARAGVQRAHPELETAVPTVVQRLLDYDFVQEELDKRKLEMAQAE